MANWSVHSKYRSICFSKVWHEVALDNEDANYLRKLTLILNLRRLTLPYFWKTNTSIFGVDASIGHHSWLFSISNTVWIHIKMVAGGTFYIATRVSNSRARYLSMALDWGITLPFTVKRGTFPNGVAICRIKHKIKYILINVLLYKK
jgi:hypothetical protein